MFYLTKHDLAKVGVASSSLVFRSNEKTSLADVFLRLNRDSNERPMSPEGTGGLPPRG